MPSSPRAQKRTGLFPELGLGLGLRVDHYRDVLEGRSQVSWFEVVTENFMRDGGRPLHVLEKVRQDYPVVMHGVSLSIGSVDPLNRAYLKKLKTIFDRFEPAMVSDHACFAGVGRRSLHDLLPLPFTEEAIRHVVSRLNHVQEFLGRRLMMENVSSYISYAHSEMSEWEFMAEIARRADCGILLDVNNIYVSAVNHGFKARDYLAGIPRERVGQIHLAGHSTDTLEDGREFLIDTHDHPVCPEVWELYGEAVRKFGRVSTMIEWDDKIPSLARLEQEIFKAEKIQNKIQEEVQEKIHAEEHSVRPHAGRNPEVDGGGRHVS